MEFIDPDGVFFKGLLAEVENHDPGDAIWIRSKDDPWDEDVKTFLMQMVVLSNAIDIYGMCVDQREEEDKKATNKSVKTRAPNCTKAACKNLT